jgi:hypothetical protein
MAAASFIATWKRPARPAAAFVVQRAMRHPIGSLPKAPGARLP